MSACVLQADDLGSLYAEYKNYLKSVGYAYNKEKEMEWAGIFEAALETNKQSSAVGQVVLFLSAHYNALGDWVKSAQVLEDELKREGSNFPKKQLLHF